MRKFEWNDGMNLGIKAIDDDHKKLFSIINKLLEATQSDVDKKGLEAIFDELEQYALIHFEREESIMREYGYANSQEHINQHNSFRSKIPKLKKRLLDTDSKKVAQDVGFFLTEWLMSHILEEDFRFIDSLKGEPLHNINKTTTKKRGFSTDIDLGLGFKKNIYLLVLIPIFGLLLLGGYMLMQTYAKSKNISNLNHISNSISSINTLTHSLQAERGLSGGFTVSKHLKFTETLKKQRDITDINIEKFLSSMKSLSFTDNSTLTIEPLKESLATLTQIRQLVDNSNIDAPNTIEYYSYIIENILGLTIELRPSIVEPKLVSLYSALEIVLHFKEYVGKERVLAVLAIESGQFNHKEYIEYVQLLGAQKVYRDQLLYISQRESGVLDFYGFGNHAQIASFRNTLLKNGKNIADLDALVWFNLMSHKIDNIKHFTDNLIKQIRWESQQSIKKIKEQRFFTALFIVLIVSITFIIFFPLKRAVLLPIDLITKAIKGLSSGDKTFKFEQDLPRDEFGEMAASYELCRRKLLKADLLTSLYIDRQDANMRLKMQENRELQILADRDALTGLINRGKFDEMLDIEIQRASRYYYNFALLMLDLDHFKNINDRYGHSAGDTVLKEFAAICLKMVRSTDIVARVGGEEFAIILLKADEKSALKMADRICNSIRSKNIIYAQNSISVTTSIGVALQKSQKEILDAKELYDRADRALYLAKNGGRDRAVMYKS